MATPSCPCVRSSSTRSVPSECRHLRVAHGADGNVRRLPHALVNHGGLTATAHWKVYLPAVLVSFAVMVPAIIAAERKDKMRRFSAARLPCLWLSSSGLLFFGQSLWTLALWLLLFFVAFNVLEATLPSLVSRTAPPTAKGAALGVYNTTQAIGLFIGGAGGGYMAQNFGDNAVFADLHRAGFDLAGSGKLNEFSATACRRGDSIC
jgi:MFS family permease